MMRRLALAVLACLPAALPGQAYPLRAGVEAEACTPAEGDAAPLLVRARAAIGFDALGADILRWNASDLHAQAFQSDRPVPPYVTAITPATWHFDPANGILRRDRVGGGTAVLLGPAATYFARDTMLVPFAQAHPVFAAMRPLQPHALLHDVGSGDARIVARCTFRGVPRVVVATDHGRLYLHEQTAVPVKFEREEPHALWGQVRAEYVYATWWRAGAISLPLVAARYVDGVEERRMAVELPQRAGDLLATRVARGDAPRLSVPPADHAAMGDPMGTPVPVDTVRVGPATWLLTTPMYTHAVTLQRDTVFLMDATTAEWRSRADSAWIATLFPGEHPVVLVVTDIAWPHVAGVRFWAARGATIVAHPLALPFLQQVLDRRWRARPDALEATRERPRWRLQDASLAGRRAGDDLSLHAIDGVSSEGALMASVPGARFLWAGDYLQTVSAPSQYAAEVLAAAARHGLEPAVAAAQHLPLTPWDAVQAANPPR